MLETRQVWGDSEKVELVQHTFARPGRAVEARFLPCLAQHLLTRDGDSRTGNPMFDFVVIALYRYMTLRGRPLVQEPRATGYFNHASHVAFFDRLIVIRLPLLLG